jgi:hypothetical protein
VIHTVCIDTEPTTQPLDPETAVELYLEDRTNKLARANRERTRPDSAISCGDHGQDIDNLNELTGWSGFSRGLASSRLGGGDVFVFESLESDLETESTFGSTATLSRGPTHRRPLRRELLAGRYRVKGGRTRRVRRDVHGGIVRVSHRDRLANRC